MRARLIATGIALVLMTCRPAAAQYKGPKPDVGDGRVAWFDITTSNIAQSRTLRVAEGKISPFDGVVYIQVSDLPASCAKAKELGGMIPPGFPFDLPDNKGAVAIVADPAGHPIGMYSRTALPAAAKS